MAAPRTVRIFVSSTFSDLKEERNALRERAFPRLRQLCAQHGARFQAIDLRWGVSEEAAFDQQTMNICFDEIERCQKTTPRPNFIFLLGDRYGWRALPPQIPGYEFDEIVRRVSAEEAALLREWYVRDDNAVHTVDDRAYPEWRLKDREGAYKEDRAWDPVERHLGAVLRAGVKDMPLGAYDRMKYEASATEQEISRGALRVDDASEHVFGFFRTISDLPRDEAAEGFIDLEETDDPNAPHKVDTDAEKGLHELKTELRNLLPGNIYTYEARWTGSGISSDHLGQLCDDVYDSLRRTIEKEFEQLEEANPLEREMAEHERFGRERREVFIGRERILESVASYVGGTDRQPLAVHGSSGSGKSALMAEAVERERKARPGVQVAALFIGATPASSDGRSLLESLCRELSGRYGVDEAAAPSDYQELVEEFPRRLALASAEQPLVLFLDALDQLSDANHARNLDWLPTELPEHVRLVVSTLPGDCLDVLELRLPAANLIEVMPMPAAEGEQLLDRWLLDKSRTLQPHQRAEVLSKFNDNGLPLYLKLAFEEARLWKSDTSPAETVLSPDIPGVIRNLFDRLDNEENHGKLLVSRSLGYLVAAKNGLTETELLDVLSAGGKDGEILQDFRKRAPKSPEVDRLPFVVWSRLYFELEPYLTERSADGTSLLGFYHRQLAEVAREDYLAGDEARRRHGDLAEYFEGQELETKRDDGAVPNLRKLSELPFHQTYAESWNDLLRTLSSPTFIQAGFSGGMRSDLVRHYRRALEMQPPELDTAKIEQSLHFVLRNYDTLSSRPFLVLQQATNEPEESPIFEAAATDLNRSSRPWVTLVNKPKVISAHWATLENERTGFDFCAGVDAQTLLACSKHGTAKLWDISSMEDRDTAVSTFLCTSYAASGDMIAQVYEDKSITVSRFEDPTPMITTSWSAARFPAEAHVLQLASGIVPLLISFLMSMFFFLALFLVVAVVRVAIETGSFPGDASNPPVQEYSATAETWIPIALFSLSAATSIAFMFVVNFGYELNCCALSKDGRLLAAGMWALRVWDLSTGTAKTFRGHRSAVEACAFSSGGDALVSGARDGRLIIWDANAGRAIRVLRGHKKRISCCAISPDATQIMVGFRDGRVELWDANDGQLLASKVGHSDEVSSCAFSSDGTRLATASRDSTIKIWSKAGELLLVLGGHSGPVNSCSFLPETSMLVSASDDGTVRLWSVAKRTTDGNASDSETFKGHRGAVSTVDVSKDGGLITSGSSDGFALVEGTSGRLIDMVSTQPVIACRIAPAGGQIATAHTFPDKRSYTEQMSYGGGLTEDTTRCILSLRDVGSPRRVKNEDNRESKSGSYVIEDIAFSPDGRLIAAASEAVRIWSADWVGSSPHHTLVGVGSPKRIVFSPDSLRLACGTQGGRLVLYDIEFRAAGGVWSLDRVSSVRTFDVDAHQDSIAAVRFSPSGDIVLSASRDGIIKLWDSRLLTQLQSVQVAATPLNDACYSPDGRWIVTADDEGVIGFWASGRMELMARYWIDNRVTRLAWSSIGLVVAGDASGQINLLTLRGVELAAGAAFPGS